MSISANKNKDWAHTKPVKKSSPKQATIAKAAQATTPPPKTQPGHANANDIGPQARPDLIPVDKAFLTGLRRGDRLFHFARKGNAEQSFATSPSAEETLYSVIDLPSEDEVVLLRAFDKDEQKHSFSHADLLAGDWWRAGV